MPFADSSPVRRARMHRGLTQRELAEMTGLSPSTIGVIERLRNPDWVRALEKAELHVSLTTVEVAVRICAAFGLLQYGRSYTIDEVARAGRLFAKSGLTDRGRRCKLPYPDRPIRHLRAA